MGSPSDPSVSSASVPALTPLCSCNFDGNVQPAHKVVDLAFLASRSETQDWQRTRTPPARMGLRQNGCRCMRRRHKPPHGHAQSRRRTIFLRASPHRPNAARRALPRPHDAPCAPHALELFKLAGVNTCNCLRGEIQSIACGSEAWNRSDDTTCIGKNSPRSLPRGGDGANHSDTKASAMMRVSSGSAPGNVSNGGPDNSGD
jgi:hypothetical protein